MTERKEFGKIKRATFGCGGHDDAMIGFGVTLGGEAWGVDDFVGTWATRPEHAQYSVEEHQQSQLEAVGRLREVLNAAKKRDVSQLVGVPIEVTFDGLILVSWRVLSEVL